MATRNAAMTIHVFAFNKTTNEPVTGDAANLSLFWALESSAPVASSSRFVSA